MDKELISDLKMLVNNRNWDNISSYIGWRREQLVRALLQVEGYDKVNHIRGQIEELDRLRRLRDDVNSAEKEFLSKEK